MSGTAGHIDHGKTSLIKALTGQDTDRLKEEKERGISIDLGFAYLDLDDGTRAGIIDVPGHERFIRNMLAGAHGIDLVLFTVAADDGVMPQTVEHLDILHVLGVTRAIFVITKTDLVPAARAAEVEEEIQILVAGTSLEGSAVVPFSFVSGEGLEELRSRIAQVLRGIEKAPPRGYFRLPVDRVFVLQGHGVVVTGTALQGEVNVGDRIRCLPGDQLFRVRSLQVHGQPVASATWGQRLALNLTGQEKPSMERGDVLCHEQITLTSDRFDATLEVRQSAAAGIKNHQHVRVHLGTAERLGKAIVLGSQDLVAPGRTAFCQIVISEPLVALRGDHFVIRDETAQRTLGGGIVLHPWPHAHKRREPGHEVKLKTLRTGDHAAVAEVFLDERDEFALPSRAAVPVSESPGRASPVRHCGTCRPSRSSPSRARMSSPRSGSGNWLKQALLADLHAFHRAHPIAPGRDMEELRDKLPARIAPKVFRAFVERLEDEKAIAREGNLLRLPEHKITSAKR